MKKNIAIFSDFSQNSGGAFHEASYLAKAVIKNLHKDYNFTIIVHEKNLKLDLGDLKIEHKYFYLNSIERYLLFSRNYNPLIRRIKKYYFTNNKWESFIKRNNIDLVFFPGPSQYSMYLEDTDFIITVPDVCHRENLEVPEWTKKGEFIRREELLQNSLIRSVGVITNANSIRDSLINFYKIDPNRVYVINQQPSDKINNFIHNSDLYIEFKKKFKLPNPFLFYPAMYLPQKNHKYIMNTLNILNKEYNIKMSAVFCGVDKGYLSNLKKYYNDLNLDNEVIFLNFVESKYLPYFYKDCFALAMPTLSGPTNLPVWEGFKMEKIVFYSKLPHSESIYGDGPVYIDPLDPRTMAAKINLFFNNPKLIQEQVLKGSSKLQSNNFSKEVMIFKKIFDNYFKTKEIWNFK